MKRSIIITDLTRFKAGNPNVCTAGIDRETGECIRPMPYLPFTECMRLGILPGGILTGEFTPSKTRTAPHTEDCNYQKLTFDGPCSGEEFRKVLVGSCFASVEKGFEVSLPAGEKVIPASHQVQQSIITLQVAPNDIEIVEDSYKPGSIKLHFTDSSGHRHRFLPITDLGFYDYAQRYRESSALRVRLDEHRAALLAIKRGDQPWPEVNAWRLRLHQEFDEAFASTPVPERPDYDWANNFLLKARREMAEGRQP